MCIWVQAVKPNLFLSLPCIASKHLHRGSVSSFLTGTESALGPLLCHLNSGSVYVPSQPLIQLKLLQATWGGTSLPQAVVLALKHQSTLLSSHTLAHSCSPSSQDKGRGHGDALHPLHTGQKCLLQLQYSARTI